VTHLDLKLSVYRIGRTRIEEENRMPLNVEKTYEMVVRRHTCVVLPELIPSIKRKTWLKLLVVTLQDNPCNWDLHFEEMLKKASGRMYIMRVYKYYGLSIKQLDLLFDSLIMSIFTFAIELWSCAYDGCTGTRCKSMNTLKVQFYKQVSTRHVQYRKH
jgi:hypothetical protein